MAYLKNTQYTAEGQPPLRCIVYSPINNRWSAVAKVNRRNEPFTKGTYQIVAEGDVVMVNDQGKLSINLVRAILNKDSPDIDALDMTTVIDTSNTSLIGLLTSYTDDVVEWLFGEIDDQLPAGVGWDGSRSMYEVRKRERLRNLFWDVGDDCFTTLFKQTLLNAAQVSPFKDIPIEWDDAVVLNNDVNNHLGWKASPETTLIFVIQWSKDNNVDITKFEDCHPDEYYTVEMNPTTVRALVGEIYIKDNGEGQSTFIPAARWELFKG